MRLQNFLFPGLQTIDASGHIEPLTEGYRLFGNLTVLPRDLFKIMRTTIPRGDSKGILSLRESIKFENRLEDPQIIVDVKTSGTDPTLATAYFWDRAELPKSIRAIPEPLARIPMKDGARLISATLGYDGEIWDGGYCVASRWWPQAPSENEWDLFQKGARSQYWPNDEDGRPEYFPRPSIIEPEWVNNKAIVSKSRVDYLQSIKPVQVAAVSALILAFPASYTVSEIVLLQNALNKAEAELALSEQEAGPWRAAQRKAVAERNRVIQLQQIGKPSATLFALADLESELAKQDLSASQIGYDAERFEIRLNPNDDLNQKAVPLIQALEKSSNLTRVRYDASSRTLFADLENEDASAADRDL